MSTTTLRHKVVTASVAKGLAPRQFIFTISSPTLDRDKDIILLSAWNLDEYRTNPVVLASHDHKNLPVGKSVSIGVVGDKLKATVEFPPQGIYPYADTVHDMVKAGYLNSASVGFRSDDAEPNGLGGHTIKRATLLEWSICPIGSNPDALVERSVPAVMQKWLKSNTPHHMEGIMKSTDWVEIDDDDCVFELIDKDLSPFELMCQAMLAAHEEMTGEKFRELMARQLALLGPAASIYDLVQSLARDGVAAPRSAPGFRHMTELEHINYKNACDQRAGYYPY